MERNALTPDTLMIAEMAKELGISPMDLFVHWIKNGKIKNVSISVAFEDDEEIKIEIDKNSFESTSQDAPETDVDECNQNNTQSVISPTPKPTVSTSFEVDDITKTTSFSKGTIHVRPEHKDNVTVGAYVYTTGDILKKHNAIPNVNMRGIILSYTEDTITLIKYIGMGYNAIEACSKENNGWHFLSVDECKLLCGRRDKLNDSLRKTRRKQIDDSVLLLCKGPANNLTVFDIVSQTVSNSLLPQKTATDRSFYLYMTKTLKRV